MPYNPSTHCRIPSVLNRVIPDHQLAQPIVHRTRDLEPTTTIVLVGFQGASHLDRVSLYWMVFWDGSHIESINVLNPVSWIIVGNRMPISPYHKFFPFFAYQFLLFSVPIQHRLALLRQFIFHTNQIIHIIGKHRSSSSSLKPIFCLFFGILFRHNMINIDICYLNFLPVYLHFHEPEILILVHRSPLVMTHFSASRNKAPPRIIRHHRCRPSTIEFFKGKTVFVIYQ